MAVRLAMNAMKRVGVGVGKIIPRTIPEVNSRSYRQFPNRRLLILSESDEDELPKPEIHELPAYTTYCHQYDTTMGFGIDVDLGDYPDIIRPCVASLDDPELIAAAGFAVDTHNKSQNKSIQFSKVIKANYGGNMYYLTLDAIDDSGCSKKYLAQVEVDAKNEMELLLFGDVDNPPKQSKKVVFKLKPCGYFRDGAYCFRHETFDPRNMIGEVITYPRDYFKVPKYVDCIDEASAVAEDVDQYIARKPFLRRSNIKSFLDDDEIADLGRFAVEQYNREEEDVELQFVRVIEGSVGFIRTVYDLTLEVMDNAVKKIYEASVSIHNFDGDMLLLLFRPDGSANIGD